MISSKVAYKKPRLTSPPHGKEQNYEDLKEVWKRNRMESFKVFLRRYNNEIVVPTLEVLRKRIQFHYQKGYDLLKSSFTLPNIAIRILHSLTSLKFLQFNQEDESSEDCTRKRLRAGSLNIVTRHAKVWSSRIKNSSKRSKIIVGNDTSRLCPFSMMKDMPAGVYTKWD